MAIRAGELTAEAPRQTGATDGLAVHRAALWGLLAAKLLTGWGVRWDITVARRKGLLIPRLLSEALRARALPAPLSWGSE